MSVDTIKDWQEVQETILASNDYSMAVAANTQEILQSLNHGLGITPFIDYQISADGGATFYDPAQFQTIDSLIYCEAFCDNIKIYFSYHYSSASPANPALLLVFRYKLYVTEVSK